jgi:hypothetical protein
MSEAFSSAVFDLRPEIKECIGRADPIVPNLQYTLRVRFIGSPTLGSMAEQVTFLRIDPTPGVKPMEVKTDAETCVAAIVGMLELPPSDGPSEILTVLRYDDCTPKVYIAKGTVTEYARAYASWSTAHPGKKCPDSVEDLIGANAKRLDPWGRPFKLLCGSTLPQGAGEVGVLSSGVDGKFGTGDDIESWNDQRITRD